MSYLLSAQVQPWLNDSKFPVATVLEDFEVTASETVIGKLNRRYDTSVWTDASSTPALPLQIMAMLVASYCLRKTISEDDGESSYPEWLENRAMKLLDGLVTGSIDLPGVDQDPTTSLGGSVEFFPTDASTKLAETHPLDPEGTARMFDMHTRF